MSFDDFQKDKQEHQISFNSNFEKQNFDMVTKSLPDVDRLSIFREMKKCVIFKFVKQNHLLEVAFVHYV